MTILPARPHPTRVGKSSQNELALSPIPTCLSPVNFIKLRRVNGGLHTAINDRRSRMETNDWSDAERRVERAQELFEQRKWHEALEELRAAININPYNSAWFFNIGLTLDELGRTDEAIEAYEQALLIDPDDLQSLNRLGVDQHQAGQFKSALTTFNRIQVIDPSFEPSYCNRILTYSEMGDHEKAEEMFYLARLYKEHCPHCYYYMGCSLAMRGMYDKAIYCWKKTLDLQGNHPQVHVRIAEALRRKGDLEQSRRYYLTGLRQQPGNTAALLDLSATADRNAPAGRGRREDSPGDRTGPGESRGLLHLRPMVAPLSS